MIIAKLNGSTDCVVSDNLTSLLDELEVYHDCYSEEDFKDFTFYEAKEIKVKYTPPTLVKVTAPAVKKTVIKKTTPKKVTK